MEISCIKTIKIMLKNSQFTLVSFEIKVSVVMVTNTGKAEWNDGIYKS